MRRVINVVRLQLINRQTFVWIPLLILGAATVMSIAIYMMIPSAEPKYGGGGQAPLWYFFAIGLSAMNLTFPFSQAMSITRRDFFLGTMLTAVGSSALMAVLYVIGGAIELATNGYGLNGWMFYLPWLWEAGPVGAFVVAFALALFFFVIGFTGATVYKRWGPLAVTIASVGAAAVLIGLLFLAVRLGFGNQIASTIMSLGAFGLALWGLVVVAVLSGLSFLVFRRTIP